ncbi:ankyrin repeat protein, partial [Zopfia rhizophila CBS 207.26]
KDEGGRTPLSMATEKGHREVIQMLLSAGSNINNRDSLGQTPLHIAISVGHLEIAIKLISSRADINSPDQDGMTPLRLAFRHKNHRLIQLLLKRSA